MANKTINPKVSGFDKPCSGAINNPNTTAGTMMRKETINFEVKLIVCFLPH
jgi:hypothetical protein